VGSINNGSVEIMSGKGHYDRGILHWRPSEEDPLPLSDVRAVSYAKGVLDGPGDTEVFLPGVPALGELSRTGGTARFGG